MDDVHSGDDRAAGKRFQMESFDITKVWFQGDFPLIEVGEMELNEVPVNYFAHVEQSTFSPSNLINGISFSPDKMLQGRLFSYPDAHRYRVGVNSHQLEVNRCPLLPITIRETGLWQTQVIIRINRTITRTVSTRSNLILPIKIMNTNWIAHTLPATTEMKVMTIITHSPAYSTKSNESSRSRKSCK